MDFTRSFAFCFGVFLFTLTSAGADAPGVKLEPRSRIDTMDEVTHGDMRWTHGAFVYMDLGGSSLPPSFHVLDRDGQLISRATLNAPGASQFWYSDFDRGTDGVIVFAGGAYSFDGQVTPFIAWISPNGQTSQIMRTAPYYAYKISVAADGTFWTLGYEMIKHDAKAPELDPKAPVLRHFDATGKIIGSAIPQSQLGKAGRFRIVSAKLIATNGRVAWYSLFKGQGKYVEFEVDSMLVHEYPGPTLTDDPLAEVLVAGLTSTDDGTVAVSIQDLSPRARSTYVFDRGTSKWVPLHVPSIGKYNYEPYLSGSDHESLVFQYEHSAVFFNVSH